MSITRVVFIGSNDDQVHENFTLNSVYLAQPSKNGFLTVLDDKAILVEMPMSNFNLHITDYSRELAYVN